MTISNMIVFFVISLTLVATLGCPTDCTCSTGDFPTANCYGRGLETISFNFPEDTYSILLDRNNIPGIPSGVFANLPYLNKIDMSYNKIKTIEYNAFGESSSLQILRLQNNPMTKIEDTYFKHLRNLSYL
ncbi:leucine-rich repeat-containing protein 3-like [Mytilus trossulus]|uniref:leucine-rich repeat-containing protein 3-like n=1 Tax=Mytilus trossulus TaxID=6551 RepID=UPI003007CAC4